MSTGNFLAGFGQSFGAGLQRAQEQKRDDEDAKLRKKLVQLQLEQAERKGQGEALVAQLLRGETAAPVRTSETEIPGRFGQMLTSTSAPGPSTPGLSPAEMLQDPRGISALLASGQMGQFASLAQSQQGERPRTAEDSSGVLKFVDGPSAGQPVPGFETGKPPTLHSAEGQRIQDLESLKTHYGEDSPQYRALAEARGSVTREPPKFGDVAGLRKEFAKGSDERAVAIAAFDRMRKVTAGGAGDIAMIFQFMKLLDPGSRVTEGEVALAGQVSGKASQFLNLYNRIMKGEVLTDKARADLLHQGANIARDTIRKQRASEGEFRGIAERWGIDERDVIVDFVGETEGTLGDYPEPDRSLAETASAVEKTLAAAGVGARGVASRVAGAVGAVVDYAKESLDSLLAMDPNTIPPGQEDAYIEALEREQAKLRP